ncbi:type IV pilin protein [Cupriavidus pampae]|uniref:Prepilin-type N-terminal cleavage/methylation domain-containing protein n=1 Tax=Cupriavidus pampae TaxID=659251 RepID=A0ABN7YGN9_9BURK|nr:type IV pilin protein [Cupriavidus pampae]CAG9171451.1 hypothetical protein LMG32289_02369 [Cupriavidus pampae]
MSGAVVDAMTGRKRLPQRLTWQPRRGFTLMELMVAVAIVAILAAIAVSNYREHVAAVRRADARAALLDIAARQARHMTMHGAYTSDAVDLDPELKGTQFPLSVVGGRLSRAKASDKQAVWYRVSVTLTRQGQGFEATAQPVNGQSDDRCGVFVLDDLGQQSTRAASPAASQCW